MKVFDKTASQSPYLVAAQFGADAEMALMIEAQNNAQKQRDVHRKERRSASKRRLEQSLAAAAQLRKLADNQRARARWGMVFDAAGLAAGGAVAACGQPGIAPQVATGVSQLGRGVYDLAHAGDESRIQGRQRRYEALAQAAGDDVAYHTTEGEQARQRSEKAAGQLQRYVDLVNSLADTSARST